MRVVVVYSGGLDSTVLLYHLRQEGHAIRALSVDYGQRHRRELDAATEIAAALGVEHRIVDLRTVGTLLGGSALTAPTIAVPREEYARKNMETTTVPNRNMLLLALAIAWAAQERDDAVAFAAHAGRTLTYPDCRPDFAAAMDQAAHVADWQPIAVLAPFVTWHKADIVRRGQALGVPFERTWSCYVGGVQHCGECGTCRDRRAAFAEAGVSDPTAYG
jgi:7-cyano-7-deazaguanine synthase